MPSVFSGKEILLLKDESFFQRKKLITEKIYHQLSATVKGIQSTPSFEKISFPKGTDISTGKISKGENYLGLPYIILDFPKLFSSEKIFAFRTMIWWGNFVSCTLLVSGDQAKSSSKKFREHYSALKKKEVFLCVNPSGWHHHFEKENYRSLKFLTKGDVTSIISKQEFLKVARKIPITEINRLEKFAGESFEIFSSLMPGD